MSEELRIVDKQKNTLPMPGAAKRELTKRRTPFSKTYLNPDGSFSTEISSTPVNFKNKSGNWKTIDNTLVTKSKDNYQYENLANSITIRFAENNINDRLVYYAIDDLHWITFSPSEAFTQQGSPQGSSIYYKGIRQNVDLEYIVQGNTLKENIILNSYPTTNSFSFDISYEGIKLESQSDGSIIALDSITNQQLFFLNQPVAVDSNGMMTDKIKMYIVSDIVKERLVITVNYDWLINSAYPVVIDPQVTTIIDYSGQTSPQNILDTFISSGRSNVNYLGDYAYLHAGTIDSNDYLITRSAIWFKYLPTIPPGAKITSAILSLYVTSLSGSSNINMYRITSDWSEATAKWITPPQYDTANPLAVSPPTAINKYWDVDITNDVTGWFAGVKVNYGYFIKLVNETTSRVSFYSSNASSNTPKITITYNIDGLGLEPFFAYHGNVNVHNGNLVISDVDVTLPGRGIPIVVSRTYNLRASGTSTIGYKWRMNFHMYIKYMNTNPICFVSLIDGDATIKVFTRNADGNYNSPPGVHQKLSYINNTFIMQEKSGVKYYFNANGYVDKIEDINGNITSATYIGSNIDTIKDPSNRTIKFNYNAAGRVDTITGNNIPTVKYEYIGTNLSKAKKLDSSGVVLSEITYNYDTNNNLQSIVDADAKTIEFTHDITILTSPRIKTISRYLNTGEPALTTVYDFTFLDTGTTAKITYPEDNVSEYRTNNAGNLASITNAVGDNQQYTIKYAWDEDQNLIEVISPKGNNTVDPTVIAQYTSEFAYDNDGNLTKETDPLGFSIIYNYNINDDIKDISGTQGTAIINSYTKDRNLDMSSTSIFSTISLEYDNTGNVLAQTEPIGIAANLVRDSGFEDAKTAVIHWGRDTRYSGTISYDQIEKVNGNYSAMLTATGSQDLQRAVLVSAPIAVTEKVTYNLSWYVKTQNAGTNLGGATAGVKWSKADGTPISTNLITAPTIGTTTGFIRKGARLQAPDLAENAEIILSLSGVANQQAIAWFDNIQFEYIPAINNYNLLYNGDFELDTNSNSQPDGWSIADIANPPGELVTAQKYSGTRSYKMVGSTAYKNINQTRELSGSVGTPILFSCWTMATGTQSAGGTYNLALVFTKLNKDTKKYEPVGNTFVLYIQKTVDNTWQYKEMAVNSPGPFDRVTIHCNIGNQPNLSVWFDDVRLRLNAAPTAVMSGYNILQNGNFEYETNTSIYDFDDWIVSTEGTVTGTSLSTVTRYVNIEPFSGKRMIRISSVPGWATVLNKIREPIKDGTAYTASAAVRTVGVTGPSASSGAVIKFNILSSSGGYLGQIVSKALLGTTDWTRIVVSASTAEIKTQYPTAALIQVAIGTIVATSGDMYFDAIRLSEGNEKVIFEYENTNNYVNKVIDQKGNAINLLNDTRGNIKQITDAKGIVYNINYDKLDRIDYTRNQQKLLSKYVYNKNGTILEIDNYNDIASGRIYLNTIIKLDYNGLNLPSAIYDPKWRPTYLDYDDNARLKTVRMPTLKNINYTYDMANRVVQKNYTPASTKWNFSYDVNSNLETVIKEAGDSTITETTTYRYDSLDRLTKEIMPPVNGIQNTADYTYDYSGHLETISQSIIPGGTANKLTTFSYDLGGINSNIIGPQISNPSDINASFMYDDKLRLKKSYVKIPGTSFTSYREYDETNKLSRIRIENINAVPVYDYSFIYDANGNRSDDIDNLSNIKKHYEYDEINQLLKEQYYVGTTITKSFTYTYDILGNRLTKTNISGTTTTYQVDNYNEIQNVGANFQYTHDKNGNIIKAGDSDFIYNAENQLVEFRYLGAVAATYEYDWRGLRTKKVTATKTELYYYTGNDLTYITDQFNKLKYYFVRDLSGRLLQMIDYTSSPAKAYIYVYDVHGNIIGLADETGILVDYDYDAWGNLLNVPQSTPVTGNGEPLVNANPFRYSGYQYDPETGLYYLKYRYYIPSLGRFLSRDPVVSYNRYMYCNNNPVRYTDPLGLINPVDELNSAPPAGPRKPPSIGNSVNNTINSPSTVLATGTSTFDFILDSFEKNAIKAARNQKFNASVAAVPKVRGKQIDEINWNVGNMQKSSSFVGEWGGPVLDVALGINTLYQDKQNYSGSDLNRAQAVTYVSTITSVGVGMGISAAVTTLTALAIAPASVLIAGGLVAGLVAAVLIDIGSESLKYYLTKD